MSEAPQSRPRQQPVRADQALIAQLFSDYDFLLKGHRETRDELVAVLQEILKSIDTLRLMRSDVTDRTVIELRERAKTVVEASLAQIRTQSQSMDAAAGTGNALSAQDLTNLLASIDHCVRNTVKKSQTEERNNMLLYLGVGAIAGIVISFIAIQLRF